MPEIKQYNRTIQRPKQSCDLECLRSGFARYYAENGRLPTSQEITDCEYLPSVKQIERRWGGVIKLRELLEYKETDFSRGIHRSTFAQINTYRGFSKEIELEQILVNKFGEYYVHSEKRYGIHKRTRMDFYVYSPDGNFGVDVFYTDSIHNFKVNVQSKMKKYIDFPSNTHLYFICFNSSIDQEFMDQQCQKMSLYATYNNLKFITLKTFISKIAKMRRYSDPVPLTDSASSS